MNPLSDTNEHGRLMGAKQNSAKAHESLYKTKQSTSSVHQSVGVIQKEACANHLFGAYHPADSMQTLCHIPSWRERERETLSGGFGKQASWKNQLISRLRFQLGDSLSV